MTPGYQRSASHKIITPRGGSMLSKVEELGLVHGMQLFFRFSFSVFSCGIRSERVRRHSPPTLVSPRIAAAG